MHHRRQKHIYSFDTYHFLYSYKIYLHIFYIDRCLLQDNVTAHGMFSSYSNSESNFLSKKFRIEFLQTNYYFFLPPLVNSLSFLRLTVEQRMLPQCVIETDIQLWWLVGARGTIIILFWYVQYACCIIHCRRIKCAFTTTMLTRVGDDLQRVVVDISPSACLIYSNLGRQHTSNLDAKEEKDE